MKGRKRHLLVDTLGWVLHAAVSEASMDDRLFVPWIVREAQPFLPRLRHIWADGGYQSETLAQGLLEHCEVELEIVKRPANAVGFHLQPKRWVVERTFAWLGRYRRLSKDYEYWVETSQSMIYLAMSHLMLRRLAKGKAP